MSSLTTLQAIVEAQKAGKAYTDKKVLEHDVLIRNDLFAISERVSAIEEKADTESYESLKIYVEKRLNTISDMLDTLILLAGGDLNDISTDED